MYYTVLYICSTMMTEIPDWQRKEIMIKVRQTIHSYQTGSWMALSSVRLHSAMFHQYFSNYNKCKSSNNQEGMTYAKARMRYRLKQIERFGFSYVQNKKCQLAWEKALANGTYLKTFGEIEGALWQ